LGQCYNAAIAGVAPQLEPALQLTEFVSGQLLRQAEGDAAADFWARTFSDGGSVLELPTDYARPAQWTFEGARECTLVDARLSAELNRLSAKHDCTLFTTLLAVQYLLLHRLSGQEDLAIGIPAADRSSKQAATLIAHTVNFLPVRLPLEGDPEFVEFLATVKKTFLEAYEHRGYSLGSLIQKLNIPRDLSRMPLVSIVFNVDRLPAAAQFTGLEMEVVLNSRSFCSFDLMFNITEASDRQPARALSKREPAARSNVGLRLDCRYNRNLFAPQTIRRWLGHFQALLEGILANPHQKISELPLLSADERQRVLVEWNATDAPYPRERCLHQLFEEQVERTPQATAVVFQDQSLTYAQLNQEANELASQLQTLGVGLDVPVGVCLERSLEMIVAVLAVLKAGGAYLPLDPGYPSERIAMMVENSRTPLIVTQSNLTAELARFKVRVVPVPAVKQRRSANSSPLPQRSLVTSANLAYVIYTSGSTGVPKGVTVAHHNAVNFIHWAKQQFTKDELAGVLFSTSLCFDLSVFELFATLSSGGRVILVPNALELAQLAEKDQVTLINTVPSAANELLRIGAIPPSTRVINLAGEPLKAELADRLYALGTIQKVYDLYGPSETTTYSTCALRRPGGPQTVGRPIANTQIYLLDAHRQPVPVGVVGEVYIGGEGVTQGYLHQPVATTDNFVHQSLAPLENRRLYKTGDLARWLPEGELELLGRNDSQVKIRGFRVEPGEIEATLLRHEAVAEAVVVPREDQPGAGRVLVAYMVAKGGLDAAKLKDEELRKFLESKLPSYMVPSHFVQLKKMPLTPNGKLNRRALPKPGPMVNGREFVPPRNDVERTLAEIWSEVLGQKSVSVRDNFFALGGHSLLATQIIWRMAKAFPVELTIGAIFEAPTIESLAELIAHAPRRNELGEKTITKHISQLQAEQLLTRLDSLSDAEVETLLAALPPSADNHGR
jgi:amino acid adenylation domain-containing protein